MAAQKKYVCAFCARAFTRSEHKQRHERSHTNEKPFHCTSCSSSFVRRDLLQRHCRTVHSIPPTSAGEKRRKSSSAPEDDDGHTDMRPPLVTKSEKLNHDMIQLLSISRKLGTLIEDGFNAHLNDHFLIGYVQLSSLSSSCTLVEWILKDLITYLGGYSESDSEPRSQSQKSFKTGIIYSIISLGYICNKDHKKAMGFFLRGWNVLVQTLIPNYNNNNNLFDQIEILNNLFLLAYIYLEYDLGKYEGADDESTVSDVVILNYLNDISSIINTNLSSISPSNLIDLNIHLFWNIYILLSTYLKPQSPKIYSFFVNRKVDSEDNTLESFMVKLSKQVVNFDTIPGDSMFLRQVVVATISNELKNLSNGEPLLIYNSRNTLHNAVILINKSINTMSPIEKTSSGNTIFELFKKNIVINSPPKFHDLLKNYLFVPVHYYQWELLNATLQEITFQFPLSKHLHEHLQSGAYVDNHIQDFLRCKDPQIEINNNLSIVSFPLIFFNSFLRLNIVKLEKFNLLQLKSAALFVIEWYLIMNKALILMWTFPDMFDSNYILQNLLYLLLDNKNVLVHRLNSVKCGSAEDEKLTFNHKWFWVLKLKVDSIFESWMDFLRTEVGKNFALGEKSGWVGVSGLKSSVCKVLDELVPGELAKLPDFSHHQREEAPAPAFINYSVDNEHQKYRRANSITLGGLAYYNHNTHSPSLETNSPASSSVGDSRNNSIGKTSKNAYYGVSYAYPPLPVLSTQQGQVRQQYQTQQFADPYVLPPLLRPSTANIQQGVQGVSSYRTKDVIERS